MLKKITMHLITYNCLLINKTTRFVGIISNILKINIDKLFIFVTIEKKELNKQKSRNRGYKIMKASVLIKTIICKRELFYIILYMLFLIIKQLAPNSR